MKEVVEVDGRTGLMAHLQTRWGDISTFDPSKITITPYDGDDDRIGWKDVHIVVDVLGPVGFCEGSPQ